MAPKRSTKSRPPRGAQKWVLAELRALKTGVRLSTSEIATRIAKASGKTFHKNSVYNALRILVRRGAIAVRREGHEKHYSAAGDAPAPPSVRTSKARAGSTVSSAPVESGPVHAGAALPHKLAIGEVLVLSYGNGELVTATNVFGKIVIERHEIPS